MIFMNRLITILSILFVSNIYSQDKQYTIALWDNTSKQLYQKVVKIDHDSIRTFVNKLIRTTDQKIKHEEEEKQKKRKYTSTGGLLITANGKTDTVPDPGVDSNYYVYIGDTIVLKTIKIPYYFSNMQVGFLYEIPDSEGRQKIMVDSVLSGLWQKYIVIKGNVIIENEKTIKNYRVDGTLIGYLDDGSLNFIQIFKNGVEKESYGFHWHNNILSSIYIPNGDFSEKDISIHFENGKIKDVTKYKSESYLKFDSTGKVIGGTLFNH
jgi:hypothetical protein